MPHPLSNGLRLRVVAFVEAGRSRNEAAEHFGISVSFTVNPMKRWRGTGSVEPRSCCGLRHGRIAPHKDYILAAVVAQSDITMPELVAKFEAERGVKVDPSRLSQFLNGCGLNHNKLSGQANKKSLSWQKRALTGKSAVSRSCEASAPG